MIRDTIGKLNMVALGRVVLTISQPQALSVHERGQDRLVNRLPFTGDCGDRVRAGEQLATIRDPVS